MKRNLALIITPAPDDGGANARLVERHVRASGLELLKVQETDAVARLREMLSTGTDPSVVVLGPDLDDELKLARGVRKVWSVGQLLFLPERERSEELKRKLRFAPLIGSEWALIELEDAHVPQLLQRAAQTSQQRVKLRTTLDRANLKLHTYRQLDSVELRKLVVSEHYLASLLEQSQESVIALDAADRVYFCSAGMERQFGLNGKSIQGLPVRQLPFWSASLEGCLDKVKREAKGARGETVHASAEGKKFLEVLFSAVRADKGDLIGVSLVVRDVSRQKHLLESERNARLEAENLGRMKDEFLAMLSHELRTPLSAVIGRAQLLQLQYRHDKALLESLTIIERNALMQAKLIDDLLDVSSIITGKLKLDMKPLSPREIVEAAAGSIRPEAASKQIEIRESVEPTTRKIHGDPDRLQQVLFNLLSNAVKFTPPGGRIEVAARQLPASVEITVSDNGAGISPEYLELIFNRFAQEDSSSRRKYGGMGLGLSISKQLVELHGGEIAASSAGKNQGATFTVSLPTHESGSAPQAETQESRSVDHGVTRLNGCRILVVEDIEDTRDLVEEVLRKEGADVLAVESSAAALSALTSFDPHLLVSDIGLPDMDGYELIGTIRAMGYSGRRLPAIALTAYASAGDRTKALLAGFQLHLGKPLIVRELVGEVSRLLSRKEG